MKIWKLVLGILSMIIFIVVTFQSCAVGLSNAIDNNTKDLSASAGIALAVLMLTGGIVSVVTRKSKKNGGNIALIILFGLAAMIGLTNLGKFEDLIVWSIWCLFNVVIAIISLIINKNINKNNNKETKDIN